jgi:DDE superfamily endonuclease
VTYLNDKAKKMHSIPFSPKETLRGRVVDVSREGALLSLPPRAPELNPQENIWQFMRANWLSNRIFKSFDDIVDHCCYAWNTLIDQPWKIMSIARRDWAVAGHLL